MELALFMFLAGIAENVSNFCIVLGLAILALLVSCGVWNWIDDKEFKPKPLVVASALILLFVGTIIPNEKTMYLMAAGYGTQSMVQSETADKVLKIVNSKLDEYLEDVEKSVKEEVKK